MLAPGTYRAVPIEAVLGITETGKEQLAVTFQLLDPPDQKAVAYLFFTEKTLERTIESLRYMGWTGTNLAEFEQGRECPAGFGSEVEIVVEHEQYEGRTQVRVRWINRAGGPTVKTAITGAAALSFAARMKAQIVALDAAAKAAGGGNGAAIPPVAKNPSPAASPNADDIPF